MKLSTPKTQEEIQAFQKEKAQFDFIYQTNQKLQNLSGSIVDLSLLHEKTKAKIQTDHKYLQIAFENLQDGVEVQCESARQLLGDYSTELISLTEDIIAKFQHIFDHYVNVDLLDEQLKIVKDRIEYVNARIDVCKENNMVLMRNLSANTTEELCTLREELTPIVPEIDPIQFALSEQLTPILGNMAGMQQEIERLKKQVEYGEKKFENLYTLIERLKKE